MKLRTHVWVLKIDKAQSNGLLSYHTIRGPRLVFISAAGYVLQQVPTNW